MEFCHEYWRSHQQGALKRAKIISILQQQQSDSSNRGLTTEQIAQNIGLGTRQIKKHMNTLIMESKVYRDNDRYFLKK
ncbi:MAG: hypothetical protein N5P05_002525 [Chroococcopsis gigantea SAG 12.99]|jgi:predicted ArsR family transcriptional regulator|nr:hypothetical protein [Chroococcopsis gigantea SAG 12.99]